MYGIHIPVVEVKSPDSSLNHQNSKDAKNNANKGYIRNNLFYFNPDLWVRIFVKNIIRPLLYLYLWKVCAHALKNSPLITASHKVSFNLTSS